ncbi:hypothetical protein P9293_21490 [Bacillus inaquosorum]|uniref:hypothetical protein n=1 Tax=Bacillus subtilis group TaxID=653685 RepID=UPI00036DA70B|nr:MULTISPECIES: hypothetical protein [Bacillus subtilis group]MED4649908.1 hypothetical protein [Bacillus inaquosorum]MED4793341.1 hypothetical protein [Bacillus inaquosorum]QAT44345.1 hypothetical protein EQZ01_01040 [Bacillus subtilis]
MQNQGNPVPPPRQQQPTGTPSPPPPGQNILMYYHRLQRDYNEVEKLVREKPGINNNCRNKWSIAITPHGPFNRLEPRLFFFEAAGFVTGSVVGYEFNCGWEPIHKDLYPVHLSC